MRAFFSNPSEFMDLPVSLLSYLNSFDHMSYSISKIVFTCLRLRDRDVEWKA